MPGPWLFLLDVSVPDVLLSGTLGRLLLRSTVSPEHPATMTKRRRCVVGEFFNDLGKALRAWRVDPKLPLLTTVLYALAGMGNVGGGVWFLVAAPIWFLLIGFYGAQREWYRVVWEGRRWSLREVWAASRAFWLPFAGLGVIFMLVSIPVGLVGLMFEDIWSRLIPLVLADMLFTFASPALVFTTSQPTSAFSHGWGMLKRHWRHGLPYIVVPPLVVQALWSSPDIRFDLGPALAISITGGVVALLFKGATAAFYLRHGPPPEEDQLLFDLERFRRPQPAD